MEKSNIFQLHGRKKTTAAQISSTLELQLKSTLTKMMNDYPESPLDFLGTVADFLDERAATNEYC
ncbi:MAG: hypothetical protein WCR46_14520 [Deltaproteobacteria bacterium]